MNSDEVSVAIAATPGRVWSVVSDVARMGEWSPETRRVELIDGATSPAEGVRFRGGNVRGPVTWSTTCRIVRLELEREFTFEVEGSLTRWSFRLAPDGTGTRLTEAWTLGDPRGLYGVFDRFLLRPLLLPITGRAGQLRGDMRRTLDKIKAAAESG